MPAVGRSGPTVLTNTWNAFDGWTEHEHWTCGLLRRRVAAGWQWASSFAAKSQERWMRTPFLSFQTLRPPHSDCNRCVSAANSILLDSTQLQCSDLLSAWNMWEGGKYKKLNYHEIIFVHRTSKLKKRPVMSQAEEDNHITKYSRENCPSESKWTNRKQTSCNMYKLFNMKTDSFLGSNGGNVYQHTGLVFRDMLELTRPAVTDSSTVLQLVSGSRPVCVHSNMWHLALHSCAPVLFMLTWNASVFDTSFASVTSSPFSFLSIYFWDLFLLGQKYKGF